MVRNEDARRPRLLPVGFPPGYPGRPKKVNPGELLEVALFPIWCDPVESILATRRPNYLLRAHAGSFRRVWMQSGAGGPLYGLVETPPGPAPQLVAGLLAKAAARYKISDRPLDLFVCWAAATFEGVAARHSTKGGGRNVY